MTVQITKSFSNASEEEKKLTGMQKFRRVLAAYFISYFVLMGIGHYDLVEGADLQLVWVWRGGLMWYESEDPFDSTIEYPTPLFIVYLPMVVIDYCLIPDIFHPNLLDYQEKVDGYLYEYPDRGLT